MSATSKITSLELIALQNFPEVIEGDDLSSLIKQSLDDNGIALLASDIVIVAQKIISKSEGRYVNLNSVTPSEEALFLAPTCDKDPRLVELILSESKQVLRCRPGVIIVEHRLGFVHANAGIDRSNLSATDSMRNVDAKLDKDELVLLLPVNPNLSAEKLSKQLMQEIDHNSNPPSNTEPNTRAVKANIQQPLAVIINDSMGRAWRNGTVGLAIGSYGITALKDCNGQRDRGGRILQATHIAIADEIAAAGSLLMGQADEGCPVVILRGWKHKAPATSDDSANSNGESGINDLIRAAAQDLFR